MIIQIKNGLKVDIWIEGTPIWAHISIYDQQISLSRYNIQNLKLALDEILRVGDELTKKPHKPEWNISHE